MKASVLSRVLLLPTLPLYLDLYYLPCRFWFEFGACFSCHLFKLHFLPDEQGFHFQCQNWSASCNKEKIPVWWKEKSLKIPALVSKWLGDWAQVSLYISRLRGVFENSPRNSEPCWNAQDHLTSFLGCNGFLSSRRSLPWHFPSHTTPCILFPSPPPFVVQPHSLPSITSCSSCYFSICIYTCSCLTDFFLTLYTFCHILNFFK